MGKSYLTLKFEEFKEKFSTFFFQKKKVKALENFIGVAPISREMFNSILCHLTHVRSIMQYDFIDEIEDQYLNARLDQMQIDACDWAHRTNWLKGQMESMRAAKEIRMDEQIFMNFDKKKALPFAVPSNLIKSEQAVARVRV